MAYTICKNRLGELLIYICKGDLYADYVGCILTWLVFAAMSYCFVFHTCHVSKLSTTDLLIRMV